MDHIILTTFPCLPGNCVSFPHLVPHLNLIFQESHSRRQNIPMFHENQIKALNDSNLRSHVMWIRRVILIDNIYSHKYIVLEVSFFK